MYSSCLHFNPPSFFLSFFPSFPLSQNHIAMMDYESVLRDNRSFAWKRIYVSHTCIYIYMYICIFRSDFIHSSLHSFVRSSTLNPLLHFFIFPNKVKVAGCRNLEVFFFFFFSFSFFSQTDSEMLVFISFYFVLFWFSLV